MAITIAFAAIGCTDQRCARHSDCGVARVCAPEGVCATPDDAGPPGDVAPADAMPGDATPGDAAIEDAVIDGGPIDGADR